MTTTLEPANNTEGIGEVNPLPSPCKFVVTSQNSMRKPTGTPGPLRCTAPTVFSMPAQNQWEIDGTLTFRRSCAHGICGSDAMRINGVNRLACKVLLKDLDLSKPITVEPIKGLPVEKDMIVDMEPFFQSYREIMPFLIADESHEPTRERLQSAEARAAFDDTTKCILCAACTSSCPVFWTDGQYFGPAAIVNAHRFIFDDRDEGGDMRLEVLNDKEGVWRCRTTFNCTEACPRGIQITKAIAEVKQAILARNI